ncbi:MAG: DinB family protein [Acidimicrobiia bacterium]|nr:DinB family protein [Acidimicrobiia bacterium]
MASLDVKGDLHGYLQGARETLVWKLEGLDEYDVRRPLTPTGTNLLGLVKHSASTELGYFGEVFGRPHGLSFPWLDAGGEPNADMWATADERREDIVDRYRRAWEVADATIEELPLGAPGRVPWWGDDEVTLHHVLVHVTAETQRHAGHADIVRELVDGAAGLLRELDNLPARDAAWWAEHHDRLESSARRFRG